MSFWPHMTPELPSFELFSFGVGWGPNPLWSGGGTQGSERSANMEIEDSFPGWVCTLHSHSHPNRNYLVSFTSRTSLKHRREMGQRGCRSVERGLLHDPPQASIKLLPGGFATSQSGNCHTRLFNLRHTLFGLSAKNWGNFNVKVGGPACEHKTNIDCVAHKMTMTSFAFLKAKYYFQ